ncbi:hypothetical protein INR49_016005 [Caranx melampygus]|nr:hypothetical protein INR49_016005 [Caranx melampygus]
MAGVWCFTLFLLLWFAALSPAAESRLVQVPQSHRPAGVFLLIEGGSYTFNFTSAKDACQFLNVTIATREQMQQALNQGLETCKFGWTAEQVAVIPRLTSDIKCGQGKTGLVPWRAIPGREFGVFCFNASGGYYGGPEKSSSSATTNIHHSVNATHRKLQPSHTHIFSTCTDASIPNLSGNHSSDYIITIISHHRQRCSFSTADQRRAH